MALPPHHWHLEPSRRHSHLVLAVATLALAWIAYAMKQVVHVISAAVALATMPALRVAVQIKFLKFHD